MKQVIVWTISDIIGIALLAITLVVGGVLIIIVKYQDWRARQRKRSQ